MSGNLAKLVAIWGEQRLRAKAEELGDVDLRLAAYVLDLEKRVDFLYQWIDQHEQRDWQAQQGEKQGR